MDIAFVLPNIPRSPGGGFKVVYQYANYAAEHDCIVTIYYLTNRFLKGKLPTSFRRIAGNIIARFKPYWFKLNHGIQCRPAFDICDIKKHDVIIATAVMTAYFIDKVDWCNKKNYFIQGLETFYTNEEEVYKSYSLKMGKIVISKWINKIIHEQTGVDAKYIPNGIDLNIFKNECPIEKRRKHSIIFHYRKAVLKGCEYAIKTLELLHEKYSDLAVTVVSNEPRPKDLPQYCHYFHNISEKEVAKLNNQSRVFMCTSIEEGFGLPGLEAMACGCALVSTNFLGALEYAEDKKNALLSLPKDYAEMYNNIVALFENETILKEISSAGMRTAKDFDVKKSSQCFLAAVCEKIL